MFLRRFDRGSAFAVLLVVVLALAAFAAFHGIGRRPIWFDEGATLGMVRLPLGEFLRNAWDVSLSNQMFYYLALRPWHLFGESESTLRAFSALCFVGAIAVTASLGRRLFGSAAGLSAAVILAFHWFLIRYAQEARSYALATFLACLAAFLLGRFLEQGRRRDLAAWILVSTLAMYAHFFALFTIAAQVLSLAAFGLRERRDRMALAGGLGLIAVFATPILFFLIGAPASLLHWVPRVTVARIIEETGYLAGGTSELPLFYVFVFALVFTKIFVEADPLRRWGHALALSWAVVPLLAMAAVSLWHPILYNRYLLMSVPAWALAAGAVVGPWMEAGRPAVIGWVLLGFVVASELSVLGFVYRNGFEDWSTPAATVAAASQPGDAILYNHPWSGLAFGYYLDRAAARPEPLQRGSLLFSGDFDSAEADKRRRVWVVFSRENHATTLAMHASLIRTHPRVLPRNYGPLRVVLYERDPEVKGVPAPAPTNLASPSGDEHNAN